MTVRRAVKDAAPYNFTAQAAAVKLNQNEAALPLPADLRRRMLEAQAAVELHRYPDVHAFALVEALASYENWPAEGIAVAGGSNILIQSLVIAAGIGQRVITVSPTFSVYALQAQLLGVELTEVPLEAAFELPVTRLLEELNHGEGVLFLANPAAPTGNLHAQEDIRLLVEATRGRWTVVLDQAYHQFAGEALETFAAEPHVVVLRTFSKALGLAGVRLGYALSTPEMAQDLRKTVIPFSVSMWQQVTAEVLLADREFLAESTRLVISERERVLRSLDSRSGITAFPSAANFLLFQVEDAAAVHSRLLEQGVLIRRQDHLPGLAGCLRVSIGQPTENDAFLNALEQIGLKEMQQ